MTEIKMKGALRKTKIIATVGPATSDEGTMRKMIEAGVDLVRFNFSHDTPENHKKRADLLTKIARNMRYHLGFLGDLQGAKIRIGQFCNPEGEIKLRAGQRFVLDPQLDLRLGTVDRVGLTHRNLYRDVTRGDELILDDGRLSLRVLCSSSQGVETEVLNDAELGNNKGLHRKGGGLSVPSITAKDRRDICLAANMQVDFLAVSFLKNADDVYNVRRALRKAGSNAEIIAKIERTEAIEAIDSILEASDGVMVARGDLGVEIGYAKLTAVQKGIILRARKHDRTVITATEMLQSMIRSPVPTRAEISDVANAVLDGSDALMLSAESAVGSYPIEAINTMSDLCVGAESESDDYLAVNFKEVEDFSAAKNKINKAIALAAVQSADLLKAAAIATMTESGSTSLLISRHAPHVPIFALTPHLGTCRRTALYRGVYPIHIQEGQREHSVVKEAFSCLRKSHFFDEGDLVVLTKGATKGELGGTSQMKIVAYIND